MSNGRTHPRTWLALIALSALCLLTGQAAVQARAAAPGPDYSQSRNWLALPQAPAKPVDVFWVYPTVYQGKPILADLSDPQMREAAAQTLQIQASVFADAANIFAPLYRQANVSVLSMDQTTKERYLGVGLSDVTAAFDYYLEHLNGGRPFILAGHSQGSNLLLDFLKKRAGDPALRERLVSAYVIGWSVTGEDLKNHPALRVCQNARQTGCIITYNCVADGAQEKAPTILPGAVVVNPLTWETNGALAAADRNLGSVLFDGDGRHRTIPHFTSAQVKNFGLVVIPLDPAALDWLPFGPGVYHSYDYSLFYENLKANAAERIAAYLTGTAKAPARP